MDDHPTQIPIQKMFGQGGLMEQYCSLQANSDFFKSFHMNLHFISQVKFLLRLASTPVEGEYHYLNQIQEYLQTVEASALQPDKEELLPKEDEYREGKQFKFRKRITKKR
jgi:hypothetical protein